MKKDKYIGYLVGNKIGKSYSKDIYPSFMNVTYKQKDFKNFEDLEDFINSKEYDFINVTIPYKKDVISLLDEVSREVEKTNACNLIVNEDGKLKGYNTDCYGFTCLVDINKIDLKGKNILILGKILIVLS